MESQSSDCVRAPLWLSLRGETASVFAPISHAGALELFAAIFAGDDCGVDDKAGVGDKRDAETRNDEAGDIAAGCEAILSREPGLAVWAVCRAHAVDDRQLGDLPQAARWLAERGRHELFLHRGDASEFVSLATRDVLQQYVELSDAAIKIALLAQHIAVERGAPDANVAYWLGLLHGARRWLSIALPESASATDPPVPAVLKVIPEWLIRSLTPAETHQDAGARWVQLALEAGGDPEVLARETSAWPIEALNALQKAAVDRWLLPRVDASWVPRVVAKLARLDRLERDFQSALEAEKLEAIKELAYGAGHEINNPLANISARAQTLLDDERDPERRRRLAAINAQAFRAHEMIADMMLFARPPAPRLARIAIGDLVAEVLRSIGPLAAEQTTALTYVAPSTPLLVTADATQLAVAVRALAVNGLEALRAGGELTVTVRATSSAASPAAPREAAGESSAGVEVIVSDNGPGIADAIRPRLFDPYFSGREAGRGIGFGLCKCWRIVTGHGGNLSVANNPTGGASFIICLPSG